MTAFASLCCLGLLGACGGGDASPEQAVRGRIDGLVAAVETGSVREVAAFLHPEYRDEWHPNRAAAVRSLLGYLRRHSSIHLFTLVKSLDIAQDHGRAETAVYVAMTGVPAESVETLVALRADLYRFDVGWKKAVDGGWQITTARWVRADLSVL